MSITTDSIALIEAVTAKISDERQKNFFEGILKSLELAGKEADNEEKETRLEDAAVKYANQSSFILFRQNDLTPDLEAKLRELPTPESTSEKVKAFNDARQKRIDKINAQHQAIFEEEKALDVFTGIIAGMSKEEAEKRMKEHEKKIREAAEAQK